MKTRRMILAFVLSIACALTSIPAMPAAVAYATEVEEGENGAVSDDSTVSDGTVSGDENGEDNDVPPAVEPEKYTVETPFVFPSELKKTVKLEAEKAKLVNTGGDEERWKLEIMEGQDWASDKKCLNSFDAGDKIEIPYQAAEAGIYKVVATYQSGSPSNKLVWSELNDKIQEGQVNAGADAVGTTKTVEFDLVITEAGSGTWVFTAPDTKSPRLDKLDITFWSRDEYGAENPFKFPKELNTTVTLEAEKAILRNVNSTDQDTEQWQLEVGTGSWASGGKFVNSLNKDDKIEIHYQAEVAGTYKVVASYRSGSPNNELVWSDTAGNIQEGNQVAGSATNEGSVDKTVEFNITIDKIGTGIWTFTGPQNGSPQLDKMEITLIAEKPLFSDFVGDEAAVNDTAGAPESWGPTPDAYQYKYQKDELALFVHFGVNTFTGEEWGNVIGCNDGDHRYFTLESFEAENLVRTAKDAGFKKVIVTAKHHDGFCIWDSQYTTHDVGSTEHKIDVLEIISAACTKYDMDMGLYLSPWDANNKSFGYYDETGRILCKNNGQPLDGMTWDDVYAADVHDYNEYYNNQLIEILSNDKYGSHGKFVEIWMDGAKGGSGAEVQNYDFKTWYATIQRYEGKEAGRPADCLLFGGGAYTTVHWIGNEHGLADTTTWSKVKSDKTANDTTGTLDTNLSGGYARGFEDGNSWSVPEADARITSGWFWGENKKTPKSIKELANMYFNSVGHNAPLLLNVPPNTQGTTDQALLDRLAEFGANIKQTFDDNLVQMDGVVIKADSISGNDVKFKPGNVSDNSDDTYWAPEAGQNKGQLVIDFGKPVTFDVVSIEETIKLGQRINNYKIEVFKDGEWEVMDTSVTIGAKRLARFTPVTATQVRITVGTTNTQPFISSVGVFKASKGFEDSSGVPTGLKNIDILDKDVSDGFGFEYTDSDWTKETGAQYTNRTNMYATGKTVTVKFSGTKIYLLGTFDPTHGTAEITIDGTVVKTINTQSSPRTTASVIFESDTLTPGPHTLVLRGISGPIGIEAAAVLEDELSVFELEGTAYTVSENTANQFKVLRTGKTDTRATVRVSANPGTAIQGDFDADFNQEVVFEPGVTEQIVTINTKRNEQVTGDRYFTVELMAPEGGILGFKDVARVTIKDSDEGSSGGGEGSEEPVVPPVSGEFTVTFKEENGDQILAPVTVAGDSLLTDIAVPKKAEYAFLGWYTTTGKFDIENTKVTSNLDLVAKWLYVGEVKEEDHEEVLDRLEQEEDQEVIEIAGKVWAAGIKDLDYTGKKLTQQIRVYDGTKLLTEKKDYTVTYKNNQNAYTLEDNNNSYSDKAPYVKITMKGNYKGSKIINFQIYRQDISEEGFVADDLYFDSKAGKTAQKLNPVVTWNGKKLALNKDFTLSKASIDISSAKEEAEEITITGKGNYTGERTFDVVVGVKKEDIALSKAKVTVTVDGKATAKPKVAWNEDGVTFEESAIVVTYNKEALELGKDYEIVDYENNDKVGNATLVLEGTGGNADSKVSFHGQKRVTIQITGTAMSNVDVNIPETFKKNGYGYRAEAIELLEEEGVTVKVKGGTTELTEDDYTVSYSKNINKGTATAVLTGNPENGYTGTKKVTYKITAATITKDAIRFASQEDSAPIMKGGAKPAVYIEVDGKILKEGTDFTVTYGNNKKVTAGKDATAKITGKGNYAGGDTLYFKVDAKGIDSEGIKVVAKDLELKRGNWQQKSFKVYDADGKALKAGTDYEKTVAYKKVAEDGSVSDVTEGKAGDTIQIVVTGKGDYKGSGEAAAIVTGTYRLLAEKHDISKASITIAPQNYNGDKVTLEPTKAVFTKAEVGGKSLFVGEEASFEILEDTYQKNDKKGTAKVTIRGIGEFGGEKVVSFKIVQRDVASEGNWWTNLLASLFN